MPDRTPDACRQELAELLRRCVQCGLCLPHCATWAATGNEVLSPRGRLILLGEMLAAPSEVSGAVGADYLAAFDQCIGCRACETACPSGVPFDLLEFGQDWATRSTDVLPRPASAVPGLVQDRLDRSAWLRLLSWLGASATTLLRGVLGTSWRQRLAAPGRPQRLGRLLGTLPRDRNDRALVRELAVLCGHPATPPGPLRPAAAADPATVAFFTGCANEGLLPATSRRCRELLVATGCRIEMPAGQDCCGALAEYAGLPGRAQMLQRCNQLAFAPLEATAVIVAEAAGCGANLAEHAAALAHPVRDAVVYLAARPLPPLAAVPLRVALHDPCHARHGQGIVDEPRALLGAIPELQLLEPRDAEVCCGSGGAWGLRYPQLSAELGRRKAEHLLATGADLVVTSNPGCLGQIADGLALAAAPENPGVPIMPLTDLVWYAAQRAAREFPG